MIKDNMTKEDVLKFIKEMYQHHLSFHRLIGIQVNSINPERAEMQIKMRSDLVGNPIFQILHGGVTASLLDSTGGMAAAANIINRLDDLSPENIQRNLSKLGTIDLRIDYLRPGRGDLFIASARIIRQGNKVAVARMEMHNGKGDEIALGTATYLVG